MFSSVLCPVDFSDHAREALRHAFCWAGRFDASLTVLSVNDPRLVRAAVSAYGPGYLEHKVETMLGELITETVPGSFRWAPKTRLLVSDHAHPEQSILEVARQERAGLVVMGTHGVAGYRKVVFGSTTEKVLREAPVPVLAVPKIEHPTVSLEPDEPVFHFERILVPVDFGPSAEADLQVAADLAQRLKKSILLFHVVEPSHGPPRWPEPLDAETRIRVAEATEQIDELPARLGLGRRVETLVTVGWPPDEIAVATAEKNARLVVVGLGGAPGGSGRSPGSIAYRILCVAPAPVLALPPPPFSE